MNAIVKIYKFLGVKGVAAVFLAATTAGLWAYIQQLEKSRDELTAKLSTTTASLVSTTAILNATVAAYKAKEEQSANDVSEIETSWASKTKAAVKAAQIEPSQTIKIVTKEVKSDETSCPNTAAYELRNAYSLHDVQAAFNDSNND